MLQIYSSNLDVPANAAYPLNTSSIQKGTTVVPSGAASIQLNRCGVYNVHCDAYCEATDAGLVSIQMCRNGIAQPQAITTATGDADTVVALGFDTLVQVAENNTNCCCTSPTVLQFINGETPVTGAHINVTVTKIC